MAVADGPGSRPLHGNIPLCTTLTIRPSYVVRDGTVSGVGPGSRIYPVIFPLHHAGSKGFRGFLSSTVRSGCTSKPRRKLLFDARER